MNQRLENAKNRKTEIFNLKQKVNTFLEDIKSIDWKDLNITSKDNGNSKIFIITLSDALNNSLDEIVNSVDFDSEYADVFRHIIWGHPEESFDEARWSINVKSFNNRIDINSTGLPYSFREKGLGKKIYKKVINEVGYILTKSEKSFKFSDLLWESLTRDKELYCFISEDEIIATLKNNVPNNFLTTLEDFFSNKDNCEFDQEFCKLNSDKIQKLAIKKHCV